jgi:hypothetical protein
MERQQYINGQLIEAAGFYRIKHKPSGAWYYIQGDELNLEPCIEKHAEVYKGNVIIANAELIRSYSQIEFVQV